MKVLFTAYPESTHFMLMAPLAWALRTAGHEVRVAVQPKFAPVVTQAGLTAVPVGSDRDLWQIMRRDADWLDGGRVGWPAPYDGSDGDAMIEGYRLQVNRWHKVSNTPMIADLVGFARSWRPDLVLWEPTTYAGGLAAVACGAAHGRMLIGEDVFGQTRARFLTGGHAEDPLGAWLSGYARRYGFAFDEELVTGQFTVDQLPPALRGVPAPAVRVVPMRYTQYGGAASIPAWVRQRPSRPRVAVTLGLTATDHAVGYAVSIQELLDAFAGDDLELVVTIPLTEQARLTRFPSNVRLVDYVPLQALLPTCSAVVHHAGVGTLLTSALHAVPQLALPFDVDQPLLGSRLVASGAGLSTYATDATGEVVREQVLRLLREPSFAAAARDLAGQLRSQPTPNEVAALLRRRVMDGAASR
ncbi:DUF1205 domain-containing protein [Dactylosporangium sp. NBC_01737]|uniref:nucleotide disphospho-sugar-binding domain-containing protein n=1 Tax=Dactylosporangium sp. NBC_01737 TaxID=2975959 RepID=UPI002E14F390|nr:DUF1205 domain-containing protein [Dactylosporangium sp. NBC_01737]